MLPRLPGPVHPRHRVLLIEVLVQRRAISDSIERDDLVTSIQEKTRRRPVVHLSSAWSFSFEIGPKSGRLVTLKSANGKSQIIYVPCSRAGINRIEITQDRVAEASSLRAGTFAEEEVDP